MRCMQLMHKLCDIIVYSKNETKFCNSTLYMKNTFYQKLVLKFTRNFFSIEPKLISRKFMAFDFPNLGL